MHDGENHHVAAFADRSRCSRLDGPPSAGASLLRPQALSRGNATSAEGLVRPLLAVHPVARPAPLPVGEARPPRRRIHATAHTGRAGTPRSSPCARDRRAAACRRHGSIRARVRSLPAGADPICERALDRGTRRVAGRHSLAVRACRAERRRLAARARSSGRLVPHPARIRETDSQGSA
jgi:hypothetical protein